MAEFLSPIPGKPAIEKLPGRLVADATSYGDPISETGQVVEIQHTVDAPDGGSGSSAALMADVIGESVADPEEAELRNALERDLCQLTIRQAEAEAESGRLGTVDVEGGKDVVETVKLGDLHEAKDGKNAESVEDEDKNGWGYVETGGTVKADNLPEGKGGENSVGIEDENGDRWGYVRNVGMLKVENGHGEKGGENAVCVEDDKVKRWGYMDIEGTLKLDNLHKEKGGENAERLDQNENRWDLMENEGTLRLDNHYKEKGGENTDSVEDQNENRWRFMENERASDGNEGGKSLDAVMKFGRYNKSNNNRCINYPMRHDAEDCAYYMKSGFCKFGLNCKFNHPPQRKTQVIKEKTMYGGDNSERAGQTECKYYLASGWCKYGKDCRYSHGSDNSSKSQTVDFNFLGLPIRPGEKECPYYMRNGTCKYGSNCRFHHPEPTTVVGADSPSVYDNGGAKPSQLVSSSSMSSWSSPRAINEVSSFKPAVFSGSQDAPSSDPEWNDYQVPNYTTSKSSLPTPPAFALSNLPTEINFPMQHQHDMVLDEFPERLGEPECSFFIKTGDCKFKSNCKFHHPKNHIPKPKANSCTLNDKGLPLRPDQPICTHYHRYGICKFGPACKYDHPSDAIN